MNRKLEKIIIGAILIALVLVSTIIYLGPQEMGDRVKITLEGEVYGIYPLNEMKIINVDGENIIEIRSNTVKMTEAKCPNHLCVKQGEIKEIGESIVCLPHKLIITIEALNENE